MDTRRPYPWQTAQWQQFAELVQLDRLPHALLLTGPAEIGKFQLAMAMAQGLLCESVDGAVACGRCRLCLLFQAGSHPDFLLVTPEEEGKAIKVDQIRQLTEFGTRTASQGGWRVIVVAPAEAMNVNAANAFLKTLEEPGARVLVVLVNHRVGGILPTIRSRCRIVPVQMPAIGDSREWLAGYYDPGDGVDVDEVLVRAGGRPLRAMRFLQSDLQSQIARFDGLMASLEAGELSVLEGARICKELPPFDLIEWLQQYLYDRLRARVLAGDDDSAQAWFRLLDRLTLAKQRLHSPANPNLQLLWEEVLMDWNSVLDFSARTS